MKFNKLYKKGSTFDLMYGIVVLFIAGITFLIAINVWDQIYNRSSLPTNNPTAKMYLDNFDRYTISWSFDFILVMGFVGFFVGAVILAAFARHHPILAWFNILIIFIIIIISVPLSNSYENLTEQGSLASTSSRISIFNFLMENLTMLTIIFGAFLILAMFAFKSEVTAI